MSSVTQINVNGESADPVYKFLKKDSDSLEVAWNFVKYLVVNGEDATLWLSVVVSAVSSCQE